MELPRIAITESREETAEPYAAVIEAAGGEAVRLNVNTPVDINATLDGVQGLLLTGGADIHPSWYGKEIDPAANVHANPHRDEIELPLLRRALERDMPILGICRGMQALNVMLGGSLIQDLPGHRAFPDSPVLRHEVFIPPGARMTAILGVGGFMKVNSVHHQGIRWAQKAPNLFVSAYSLLKDGIIEAVESHDHFWVVGVQWHPERRDEVPQVFRKLFASFVQAAQQRMASPSTPASPS